MVLPVEGIHPDSEEHHGDHRRGCNHRSQHGQRSARVQMHERASGVVIRAAGPIVDRNGMVVRGVDGLPEIAQRRRVIDLIGNERPQVGRRITSGVGE